MNLKKECPLKQRCLRVLVEYPSLPPQRCKECTDLVKFTIEIFPDFQCSEEDIWNNGSN